MSRLDDEARETVRWALDGLMKSYEQDPERVDRLIAEEQDRRIEADAGGEE